MLAEPTDRRITEALARAIAGIGSDQHVERLVDLIRELVPQDLVTVTRYSTTQRPEFVSHRNFSDAMVKRYLEIYICMTRSSIFGCAIAVREWCRSRALPVRM